jgi:Domain of unknown function (DUF4783)
MKFVLSIFLIVALSSATDFKTPGHRPLEIAEVSNLISHSFEKGNSGLLSTFLNEKIELVIESEKIDWANLPVSKAKPILNSFFKKNPPLSFNYIYEGNSNPALKYCVGSYKSKNADYFVYLLIKKDKDQRFLIHTIQLKKE